MTVRYRSHRPHAAGYAVAARGKKMRTRNLWLLPMSVLVGSAALAEGLAVRDTTRTWPQWQARLSLSTAPVPRVSLADLGDRPTASNGVLQGGALLGDYYFRSLKFGWLPAEGGFRATSGLMFGTRTLAVSEVSALRAALPLTLATAAHGSAAGGETVPYFGIGYTGLSVKGGWGFTADLGLTAENPGGAVRFGRALFGSQGFDSARRELRLSPLLQLGVSYSF